MGTESSEGSPGGKILRVPQNGNAGLLLLLLLGKEVFESLDRCQVAHFRR